MLPHKKGRYIVAWNIGSLWQRSYYLNHAVYTAMLSRGYTGEPKALHEFKASVLDWLSLLAVLILITLVLYLGDTGI